MTVDINCWAILVSVIASVVLGMLWYGPLFGKQWMALSGITKPDVKPSMSVMIKPIIISLVGSFFMATTLASLMVFAEAYLQTAGMLSGLQGAFWCWLGFVVPVNLSFVAWEGKPWKLFFIHAGYWLVLLAVMGMILAVWK